MDYEDAGVGSKWVKIPPPDPIDFSKECLAAAEESVEKVLNFIHPTLDSEEKRRDVIDYIQQLVKNRLLCEVVSYGSVPLKTYLPEGDIDLTVLTGPYVEESSIHDILAVIQEEERNENAEYEVRETQFIDAEVKLVKCVVGNIIIDISCNQLGGLSTLCFLEQVDRFIGRNHLFKRSIILVKAWCYYESRILGAHYGLISTYALETLVLYIFHFFNSSLSGPLSVLHRFLDYYSQFDWENYCISLKGPVRKSSFPDIVVDIPKNMLGSRLLNEEFFKSCTEMFSTSCRELEETWKPFQVKHLNVMDPLKESNNLGRSVNQGNFYRTRSALKYGSSKLRQILSQSREEVPDEIRRFFANTCERHEHRNRSVVQNLSVDNGDDESLTARISSPAVLSSDDDILVKSYGCDLDNESTDWEPEPTLAILDEIESYIMMEGPVEIASESCSGAEEVSISGYCIERNKSSFGTSNSSLGGGAADDVSSGVYSLCLSENRFYGIACSLENGSIEFNRADSAYSSAKSHFTSWLENKHGYTEMSNSNGFHEESSEATYTTSHSSVTKLLNNLDCRETDSISIDAESEVLDALADLTGDYDSHIRSLLRGQLCVGSSIPVSRSPSSSSLFGNRLMKSWDVVRRSMPLGRMSSRGIFLDRSLSAKVSHCDSTLPGSRGISLDRSVSAKVSDYDSSFASTDSQLKRNKRMPGIGTYFPKPNDVYMKKRWFGRGRNKVMSYGNPHNHNNGVRRSSPPESNASLENVQSKVQPARSRRRGHDQKPDVECESPNSARVVTETNSFFVGSCRIEFGNVTEEMISGSSMVKLYSRPESSMPPSVNKSPERQSIRLSEEEFPPLQTNCISKPCFPYI